MIIFACFRVLFVLVYVLSLYSMWIIFFSSNIALNTLSAADLSPHLVHNNYCIASYHGCVYQKIHQNSIQVAKGDE
jgi:hypothetical protein